MATSETMVRLTATARLENGRDESGIMHYVNMSLGNMDEDYWTTNRSAACDKIMAVRAALAPCLLKTVTSTVVLTEVSSVEPD